MLGNALFQSLSIQRFSKLLLCCILQRNNVIANKHTCSLGSMDHLNDLAARIHPAGTTLSKPKCLGEGIENVNSIWIMANPEQTEQTWNFKSSLNMDKGLSIHRWKIWWAIPRLLETENLSPAETYMLFCQLQTDNKGEEKPYLVMLANIDKNMGFTLAGSGDRHNGNLELHGHYNGPENHLHGSRHAVLLATSYDPFTLIKLALREIKTMIRSSWSTSKLEGFQELARHAANRPSPPFPRGPGPSFVDTLGWCTWDSFYTDLSTDKVLSGLKSFETTGVRPGFLILDDGWQSTDVDDRMNSYQWGGRLRSFLANYKFAANYEAEEKSVVEVSEGNLISEITINTTITSTTTTAAGTASCTVEQEIVSKEFIAGSKGRGKYQEEDALGYSLAPLVQAAREKYGIKQLFVWHTLSGYWSGVSPTAHEMVAFGPEITFPSLPFPASMRRMAVSQDLDREPFTKLGVGVVHPEKLQAFFTAYHATLKAMGVSGVKVDAQSVLPALAGSDIGSGNRTGGWELTLAAHSALQASVAASFGRTSSGGSSLSLLPSEFPIIHCMCHSLHTLLAVAALYPDDYDAEMAGGSGSSNKQQQQHHEAGWNGALGLRPVVRGSDDYWPVEPASHGPHLFANTMNALFLSHIGLQDWDMFQTTGGKPSAMHAAARAISGGPVYVSDKPEAHDPDILTKMVFADGAVPRCLRNALPLRRTLFTDPQRQAGIPLFIQNINGAGGGVVGIFNIAGAVLEDDKDLFRYLSPEEMIWPEGTILTTPPQDNNNSNGQKTRRGAVYDETLPENTELLKALVVHAWSSPKDVEELRGGSSSIGEESSANTRDKGGYLAWKHHDESLWLYPSVASPVPVTLEKVFDFELITYAPVKKLTSQIWVAILGVRGMYNPGGAILTTSWENTEKMLEISVLGNGEFWVVVLGKKDQVDTTTTSTSQSDSITGNLFGGVVTVDVTAREVPAVLHEETLLAEEVNDDSSATTTSTQSTNDNHVDISYAIETLSANHFHILNISNNDSNNHNPTIAEVIKIKIPSKSASGLAPPKFHTASRSGSSDASTHIHKDDVLRTKLTLRFSNII